MKKIAFLIANQSEFMETVDPYDILAREEGIEPVLISMDKTLELEMAPKGKLIADKMYKDIKIEEFDVLILPGGSGHKVLDEHSDMDKILKHFIDNKKVIGAICAAPTILGKRGFLKGKKATSWEGVQDTLEGATVLQDPVVVDGNIITSKNNITATKFGIELVRKIVSNERAEYATKKGV